MIVRLLRSQAWLYEPLRAAAAALQPSNGDKRMPGCWALVFVGWTDAGKPDIQPWHKGVGGEFWSECGFDRIPSYNTVQRRLTELEEIEDLFADPLARLVQHVRKREPRIGAAVAIDPTMVASNARPHRLKNPGKLPKRISDLPLLASKRLPTDIADDIRRAIAEEAPGDGPFQVGDYVDRTHEITMQEAPPGFKGKIAVTHQGHVYAVLDKDGGFRVYQHGDRAITWWFGYYINQPVDHFSGLPLKAIGFPADDYEARHYPAALEAAETTTGLRPFYASTDMAYSTRDCFEHSARLGVTQVSPYRPFGPHTPKRAEATVHFDEHGIPFCRNCLGGTDQVGFLVKPPKGPGGKPRPVIRVKCAAPDREECDGVQEWSLMVDPTRLLPVFRTHPAYIEVRNMHSSFERAHNEARARSNSKPRHFETRSKRVSLTLAIMRADAGALIAWLRASVINGWLGSQTFNPELSVASAKLHRQQRQRQIDRIQEHTFNRRRRLGRLGGGRHPPRSRGAPDTGAAPTPS